MKSFVILLLFCGVFLVYFLKLAPTVYSGDSGDLIAAAYFLGVPHPPGYPIYTLLGHLFTFIPANSVAWRVNLLSAVFQAATIPIVFLIIYRLTKRIILAIFASSLLAFSFTFWFYAEIAEVFALNNFFATLLILSAILFRQSRKPVYFYLLVFLAVFAFFHHQTIALIYPAIFVLILQPVKLLLKVPRRIFPVLFLAIAGFSPLLYFVFIANSASPSFWGEPTNFFNFFRLITRADYGTFTSSRALIEPPEGRIIHFFALMRIISNDFTILGLVLAFFGFVITFVKDRTFAYFLLAGFLISGPIFLMYANFPQGGAFEISVIERFTLLPAIFLVIAASLGVLYFGQFLTGIFKNLPPIFASLKFLVPVIFLLLPTFLFLENWQKIDLSGNFLGKTLAEDILTNLPENSLVLVRGDTFVFNTHYLHFVENVRPDLKIVGPGVLATNWYYPAQLQRIYPELTAPPSLSDKRLADFVKANFDKYPIFQFGPQFEIEGFTAAPYGLGTRLYRKDQPLENEAIFAANLKIWQKFRIPKKTGFSDVLFDFSQKTYAEQAFKTGNFFYDRNNFDKAQLFYLKALEIDDKYLPARSGLALVFQKLGECGEAEKQLILLNLAVPNDLTILGHLISLYRDCLKNEQMAQIYEDRLQRAKIDQFNLPPLEKF